VTPYPADDDATLWLFHQVVQKYGWDWMDKYMANKSNFIQGHLGQQRSIAAGQNVVAIDSIFSITELMKQEGKPVASHFSTVDATPNLAVDRRDLQGGAASKCSPALYEVAAGTGAAGQHRHLVCEARRSTAFRLQADLFLQGGE
jgi:hypothetical protein